MNTILKLKKTINKLDFLNTVQYNIVEQRSRRICYEQKC